MMSNQLLRAVCRATSISQRCLATTTARGQQVVLDQEASDRINPRIGNRDVVGFGLNGEAEYFDKTDFPYPAVRFGANSSEVVSLREKEIGDWKKLTLEEKKALYRASFCQTFAEMKAPTGDWKRIVAAVIAIVASAGWVIIWLKLYVYPPLRPSITREWQEAQVKKMINMREGPVEGISSKWDYEKNQWK